MKARARVLLASVMIVFVARELRAASPAHVDITWMSISNLYLEIGPQRVVIDGYITRLPENAFFGGGGGYAQTRQSFKPDALAVTKVLQALGGPKAVDLLLTGHSHFDHSFDTATWSKLSGARIIGSLTTCYQAAAEELSPDRCTPVYGGESFSLGQGVTLRVVRWNHSGDPAKNPEQHDPVELQAPPRPDPRTGGLRAGVTEDFPNGGGNRAFLFVVKGPGYRFSWFFQNSASAVDLAVPIVVGGTNYGAPIENLKQALQAEGLQGVDLWIGSGGAPIAELVLPVLKPKAYLPVHWDGLWGAFEAGVPKPYADAALHDLLSKAGVKLLVPVQYMDKWRLSAKGVEPVKNPAVKRALGFAATP